MFPLGTPTPTSLLFLHARTPLPPRALPSQANRVEVLEEERRLDRELHERQEAELGELRNQLSAFREELEASERGMRARERDVEEVKAMLAAQEEEMSARLATAEHTHCAQVG